MSKLRSKINEFYPDRISCYDDLINSLSQNEMVELVNAYCVDHDIGSEWISEKADGVNALYYMLIDNEISLIDFKDGLNMLYISHHAEGVVHDAYYILADIKWDDVYDNPDLSRSAKMSFIKNGIEV